MTGVAHSKWLKQIGLSVYFLLAGAFFAPAPNLAGFQRIARDGKKAADAAAATTRESKVSAKLRQSLLAEIEKRLDADAWVIDSEGELIAVAARALPKGPVAKRAGPLVLSASQMHAFHRLISHKEFLDAYGKSGLTDGESVRRALLAAYSELAVLGRIKPTFIFARLEQDYAVALVGAREDNVKGLLFSATELAKVRAAYRDVKHGDMRLLMKQKRWQDALDVWDHLEQRHLLSPFLHLDAATCMSERKQGAEALSLLRKAFQLYSRDASAEWLEQCGDQALLLGASGENLAQMAYEKALERFKQ